jgi:hypothetical protein
MKTIILFILSVSAVHAENWTLASGKTYHTVCVVKTMPTGVIISSIEGTALVHFADLTPELQKKFGYNAVAAAAAEADREKEAAARDARIAAGQAVQAKQAQRVASVVRFEGRSFAHLAGQGLLIDCAAPEAPKSDYLESIGGHYSHVDYSTHARPGPSNAYGRFLLRGYPSEASIADQDQIMAYGYPDGVATFDGETFRAYRYCAPPEVSPAASPAAFNPGSIDSPVH